MNDTRLDWRGWEEFLGFYPSDLLTRALQTPTLREQLYSMGTRWRDSKFWARGQHAPCCQAQGPSVFQTSLFDARGPHEAIQLRLNGGNRKMTVRPEP